MVSVIVSVDGCVAFVLSVNAGSLVGDVDVTMTMVLVVVDMVETSVAADDNDDEVSVSLVDRVVSVTAGTNVVEEVDSEAFNVLGVDVIISVVLFFLVRTTASVTVTAMTTRIATTAGMTTRFNMCFVRKQCNNGLSIEQNMEQIVSRMKKGFDHIRCP